MQDLGWTAKLLESSAALPVTRIITTANFLIQLLLHGFVHLSYLTAYQPWY